MSRRIGITELLIALNLALLGALAVAWLAPGPLARWRTWQAPAPQPLSLADVDAALLVANPAAAAAYPAVLARPLMEPARRPQAAASGPLAAASEPPPASTLDKLTLQGIVAGPTLNGVLVNEDGKSRFVRRGERVGDWTLERLSGREAVFARAEERRRIELPVAHGGPADAAAPLPVPARAPAAARPVPPPANVAAPPTPARAAPPAAATAADAPDGRPRAAFGGSADPRPRASAPR